MILSDSSLLLCTFISVTVSTLNNVITYTSITDIEADTTLTVAKSPYSITTAIEIGQNAVLTIENGVEIKFADNFQITVYGSIMAGCDELATDLDQTTKGLTNTTDYTYIHGNPDNSYRAGSIFVASSGSVKFCNTKFEAMTYPFRYNPYPPYPYNPSTFDNCEFTDVEYAVFGGPTNGKRYHSFTDCHFHDLSNIIGSTKVNFERCEFEKFSTFSSNYEFNIYNSIITGEGGICLDYTSRIGDVMGNTISNCNPALKYKYGSYDNPLYTARHVKYNTFNNNNIAVTVEYDYDGVTEVSYNNFIFNDINLRLSHSHDIQAKYNYFGDDSGALDQVGIQASIQDKCSGYSSALALYSPWYESPIDFDAFPDVKPTEVELAGDALDCVDSHSDIGGDDKLNILHSGDRFFRLSADSKRKQCVKYPDDGWNYVIDGNACTVGGNPHFRTWNGVKHDYQGQNSGQYGYMTHCTDLGLSSDELKAAMPFEIFGKHQQSGSASVYGLDYVTLKLYDEDNKIYFVHLSTDIQCLYQKNGASQPKSEYDANSDICTSLTAGSDNKIGSKFTVRYSKANNNRIDVTLTIDGICQVIFYMNGGGRMTIDGVTRNRMHYLYIEPPTCYQCFICGMCGDFGQTGNQPANRGNGGPSRIIKGWDAGNAWKVDNEGNLCNITDDGSPKRRLADFCDDAIRDNVTRACQLARNASNECCNDIDPSGTVCNELQEECDIDVCERAEGNVSLIDQFVQEIFTDPIDLLCNLSAEVNGSLFEADSTVVTDEYGQDVAVSILDILGESDVCDGEIGTFNWDSLTETGQRIPSYNVTDFYVDESDLSLNIKVELQYLGAVYGNNENEANFGVTYVLDFGDFDGHSSAINEPGTCGNKKGESFENATFSEYWSYSRRPIFEGVGNADNLAYGPPGDDWMIYMKPGDECSTVVYEGHFTWSDLRGCTDYDGSGDYTVVDNSDPNWLVLTGTFFINVVSPFWYGSDFGYYRVYQLVSQPFIIQISKSVYVLGNTGINIMRMSVLSVTSQGNVITIILVTETAEYMQLGHPTLVDAPGGPSFTLRVEPHPETGIGCLSVKQFICTQIWVLHITVDPSRRRLQSDNGSNTILDGIDLSGLYDLRFEPECREGDSEGDGTGYDFGERCTNFLLDHEDLFTPIVNATANDTATGNGFNIGTGLEGEILSVVLETALTFHMDGEFVHGVLKAKIFKVQLLAEMSFYADDAYTEQVGDGHLYQVGEDDVFVEIIVDFPDDTINVFETDVKNVWLCTFPPGTHVSEPSQNGTIGGCFDPQRDGFDASVTDPTEETFFYHIFDAQSVPILKVQGFELIDDNNGDGMESARTRFAFTVPKKIRRDTLYIHAQIEVTLQELAINTTRRLLLAAAPSANKIQHFLDSIGILSGDEHKDHKERPVNDKPEREPQPVHKYNGPDNNIPSDNNVWRLNLSSPWIMAIGGIFAAVLTCNIILLCYKNFCVDKESRNRYSFSRTRRSGYSSVKHIDSEDFDESEANEIDVVNQ